MCISCTTLRFENRCNDKIEFINVLYSFLTQVMIVSRYLLGSVSLKKIYYLLSEKMPLQVFGFVFLTLYFSFKWNLVSMLFLPYALCISSMHLKFPFWSQHIVKFYDIVTVVIKYERHKMSIWSMFFKFDRLVDMNLKPISFLFSIDTAWFLI